MRDSCTQLTGICTNVQNNKGILVPVVHVVYFIHNSGHLPGKVKSSKARGYGLMQFNSGKILFACLSTSVTESRPTRGWMPEIQVVLEPSLRKRYLGQVTGPLVNEEELSVWGAPSNSMIAAGNKTWDAARTELHRKKVLRIQEHRKSSFWVKNVVTRAQQSLSMDLL